MPLLNQLSTAEKLVGLVAAIGLAFTSFKANTIANDVASQKFVLEGQRGQIEEIEKRQALELAMRKEGRDAAVHQNELTHKVFQEFVSAVTDKAATDVVRIDRLEGVLVLAAALPGQQQEAMTRVLQRSIDRMRTTDPTVAARVSEVRFDADEALRSAVQRQPAPVSASAAPAGANPAAWAGYDFDVFWCDGQTNSAELKVSAEAAAAQASAEAKASGRWRVRPLPVNVNARTGYGVRQTEIRYSSVDEKPIAEALRELLKRKQPGLVVNLHLATKFTPNYLSVFFCARPA
jgi:hypothetical protein